VLRAWGASQFVLPHMLTLDWEGNVWLTGGHPDPCPSSSCLPATWHRCIVNT
jgi:hypothetical protein